MKFIGLIGIENDEKTLVSPDGKKLFRVPSWLAIIIQKSQHKIAQLTWGF